MRKIFLLLLLLISSFSLYGCKKEDVNDDPVYEIPNEPYVNIQDLPYSDYFNLTNPIVTISVRGMGDITIELFPNIAPNTVNNFISYIEDEEYTDSEFHRVIANVLIEGGIVSHPICTIEGEMSSNGFTNDLSLQRGVLAMARLTGDYDSQTSQFFIIQADYSSLDGEFTPFGGVTAGFNIIDFISSLHIGDLAGTPSEEIFIDSITVDLRGQTYEDPICLPSRLQ